METLTVATNKLLGALSPGVLSRFDSRTMHFSARQTLFDPYRQSLDVFFPHPGTVISLSRGTSEGPQIEVGLIGAEGFASVQALLSPEAHGTTAVVQVGGEVTSVSARRLRAEFATDFATRNLLLQYASLFMEHLTQSVVCNRVHTIEQRLSKWLLIMRDRVNSDQLPLSHDVVSKMLGIQRPGVTLAIGTLTESGLITHSRKKINVRDSAGLGHRACRCYGLMLDRLNDYRSQLTNSA